MNTDGFDRPNSDDMLYGVYHDFLRVSAAILIHSDPMTAVTVHFSQELDIFLSSDLRGEDLIFPIDATPPVKHPIEALGIPHTEVGLIAINGKPADFSARVYDGDVVHVFGIEDIPSALDGIALRPPIPCPPCFVLDTHLGTLARHLRLLGFDACYDNAFADAELAAISARQARILLTRDRGLLKHKIVTFGYCLRSTETRQQLNDVVRRYGLASHFRPYSRCLVCNGMLQNVAKADVLPLLEPKTMRYFNEFKQCQSCEQIYWRGSHVARLDALLKSIQSASNLC